MKQPGAAIVLGEHDGRGREDVFADGALAVRSRKGVRPCERALLHALPKERAGSALVVNSVEGLAGMALRALSPQLCVYCHFDDAWDLETAQATAGRHRGIAPDVGIAPDLPEGPWDLVLLPFERNGVVELLRERLRFALAHLKPGGLLFTSTDNPRDRFLREEVLELFGSATTQREPSGRGGVAYIARRPQKPKLREKPTERAFTVREGESVLSFVSRPGVFCHGRLDAGTRVLLSCMYVGQARRIADFGCGVGVIGLIAALRGPEARVTLVDSSARSVQCAQRNIASLGLAGRCETLLTADPLRDLEGGYDLVLSNPPYYGNYRIADLFLKTAAKVLIPGGRLALVTKGAEWYTAAMKQLFGNVAPREQHGYWVITSVKARS